MKTTKQEKKLIVKDFTQPKFIGKENLSEEQLNDPDYRLKWLQQNFGGINTISCSKCHHCR